MATEALDMSLDDIIKKNKQSQPRGGGRGGRGRGRGFRGGRGGSGLGFRSGRGGGPSIRPSSYSIAKSFSRPRNSFWQNNMFGESIDAVGAKFGLDTGVKLYVSNLDYGVSNDDMKQLFSEVGDLKQCGIHYDRSGRSKGTAEVVFVRKEDAMAAMRRYNGVQLDGKPMKIELVGDTLKLPVYGGRGRGRGGLMNAGFGGANSTRRRGGSWARGRGSRAGWGRGRGRGMGRGRGRGRRDQVTEKSAEELDKELEQYHAEAMQTS